MDCNCDADFSGENCVENDSYHSSKKKKEKIEKIAPYIESILNILDLEKTDSLAETPKRIAKMLINELFVGLDESNFPKYKMFNIKTSYIEPIVVDNISICSICEHHFLPFVGTATFKYIPNGKIIGLSKIPRIINFLSKKPQIQERLTLEIFNTFSKILNTNNISIEITCEHFCAKIRGIKDDCRMTTSKKGGLFNAS